MEGEGRGEGRGGGVLLGLLCKDRGARGGRLTDFRKLYTENGFPEN